MVKNLFFIVLVEKKVMFLVFRGLSLVKLVVLVWGFDFLVSEELFICKIKFYLY